MVYTAVENKARSDLPKEIVKYIEKSMTKREMKNNVIGRKRNTFPKRSETVKSNQPVTYMPELFEKEVSNVVSDSNYKHVSFDLNVPIGIVPKVNYHCSECDKKYESKLLLNHHFKIAHGKVMLFKCKLCSKKFQIEKNLQRHLSLHHGKQVYPEKDSSQKNHVSLMHWSRKEKQNLNDGLTFKSNPETKYESITFDLNDPKPKLKYQYSQFADVFESPSNLIQQFKNVHEDTKLFICKFCEKGFEKEPNLKNHVSLIHTMEKSEVSILSSGFSCSKCNCTFLKEISLKKHIPWCRKSHA